MRTKLMKMALYVLPGILLAGGWQLIAFLLPHGEFRFGSVISVALAGFHEIRRVTFYQNVGITVAETITGLLVGTIAGTLAGLLFWSNAWIGLAMRPYVVFAGAIPTVAVAPIMIELFGTGFIPKLIFVSITTFFVALVQAYEGASSARGDRMDVLVALGAGKIQILRKLIFPSAATYIIAGLRLNVGFALIGAFIAEFVNAERGLGHYIIQHSGTYDMPSVLFGVIVLGLAGLGINQVITFTINRAMPELGKAGAIRSGS